MKQGKKRSLTGLLAIVMFTLGFTGCGGDANRPPFAPQFYRWDQDRTTTNSIHISWGPSCAHSVEYRLERASSAAGPWNTITRTSGTEFTDTGLSPNTVWYYRVIGVNRRGVEGPPSGFSVKATRRSAPVLHSVEAISSTPARVTWFAAAYSTFYWIFFTLNPHLIPDVLLSVDELRANAVSGLGAGVSPSTGGSFTVGSELSFVFHNNLPADGSGAFIIIDDTLGISPSPSQPLIVLR